MNNSLERESLIRMKRITGDSKSNIQPIVDLSPSHIWDLVSKGKFPQPIRLSPKVTVWKYGAILDWIKEQEEGGEKND